MTALPRLAALGVVSVVLTATLAACGDDSATSDGAGAATSSPSSSTSSSPSTSTDAESPEASPSEASSSAPAVTPATGERVSGKTFSFVVPEGFTGSGSSGNSLAGGASFSDTTTTFCFIDASEVADLGGSITDLDGAAELQLESSPGLTRLPDREVGGEQVFAMTGESPNGTEYLFGRPVGGQVAELSFTFAPEAVRGTPGDPAADQALVESVLATVEWTA